MIGPYKVPMQMIYNAETASLNATNYARLYELMLRDDNVIAVWNNSNLNYATLTPFGLECNPIDPSATTEKELRHMPKYYFRDRIPVRQYLKIGWIKTYPETKEVAIQPYALIQDVITGRLPDFPDAKLEGSPQVNPELSLYKELIKTSYNAVYVDSKTGKICYI